MSDDGFGLQEGMALGAAAVVGARLREQNELLWYSMTPEHQQAYLDRPASPLDRAFDGLWTVICWVAAGFALLLLVSFVAVLVEESQAPSREAAYGACLDGGVRYEDLGTFPSDERYAAYEATLDKCYSLMPD